METLKNLTEINYYIEVYTIRLKELKAKKRAEMLRLKRLKKDWNSMKNL